MEGFIFFSLTHFLKVQPRLFIEIFEIFVKVDSITINFSFYALFSVSYGFWLIFFHVCLLQYNLKFPFHFDDLCVRTLLSLPIVLFSY